MARSSTSGVAIDRLIKLALAPWFREHGFARNSRCFVRRSSDLFHVASVQASQWNTPQSARFFLNLGVEWPKCYKLWTGLPDRSNPAIGPCFVQARMRSTIGIDGWDALAVDGTLLGREIVAGLDEMAEDFWRQQSNLADVFRKIETGESLAFGMPRLSVALGTPRWLVRAALLTHFGRVEESILTIDEAASRDKRTGFDYGAIRDRLIRRVSPE